VSAQVSAGASSQTWIPRGADSTCETIHTTAVEAGLRWWLKRTEWQTSVDTLAKHLAEGIVLPKRSFRRRTGLAGSLYSGRSHRSGAAFFRWVNSFILRASKPFYSFLVQMIGMGRKSHEILFAGMRHQSPWPGGRGRRYFRISGRHSLCGAYAPAAKEAVAGYDGADTSATRGIRARHAIHRR
jgi:hypothetical protein